MVPSPQTEEEKAAESTMPLIPPPSMPLELFHWHEEQTRKRLDASPQAQKETSFERTARFVAPSNIPQLPLLPQQVLLESTAEVHRDKISPPNIPRLPLPPQQEVVDWERSRSTGQGRRKAKQGRDEFPGKFNRNKKNAGQHEKNMTAILLMP
jgi:hypothetical protein